MDAVGGQALQPSYEREELLARARVVAHESVQRGGDRLRARLLHSAQRHAHVLGLDHDADALRLELTLEPVGDLGREPLLDLQRARVVLDDARELRQPDDLVVGQVGDVRHADERQQVVLAERVEVDLAGHDQLVVVAVVRERRGVEGLRRQLLDVRVDHAPRGLRERPVLDVRAERLEQFLGGGERALVVDVCRIENPRGGALEPELVAAVG